MISSTRESSVGVACGNLIAGLSSAGVGVFSPAPPTPCHEVFCISVCMLTRVGVLLGMSSTLVSCGPWLCSGLEAVATADFSQNVAEFSIRTIALQKPPGLPQRTIAVRMPTCVSSQPSAVLSWWTLACEDLAGDGCVVTVAFCVVGASTSYQHTVSCEYTPHVPWGTAKARVARGTSA